MENKNRLFHAHTSLTCADVMDSLSAIETVLRTVNREEEAGKAREWRSSCHTLDKAAMASVQQYTTVTVCAEAPSLAPGFMRQDKVLVGRDAVLERLNNAITKPNARVWLYGLPGTGKTALGEAVLDQQREAFNIVWWVDASSEASARSGVLALSCLLGADIDDPESALRWLKVYLDGIPNDWMVILDGVQNTGTVGETTAALLPSTGGHVLVTSQVCPPTDLQAWQTEELGVLEVDDLMQMMNEFGISEKKVNTHAERHAAKRSRHDLETAGTTTQFSRLRSFVKDDLGCLPLSAKSIAVVIRSRDMDVDGVLADYFHGAMQIDEMESVSCDERHWRGVGGVVAAQWANLDAPCRRLASVLAMLAHETPRSILEDQLAPLFVAVHSGNASAAGAGNLCGGVTNSFPLDNAISGLRAMGLVGGTGSDLTMHQMQQWAVRDLIKAHGTEKHENGSSCAQFGVATPLEVAHTLSAAFAYDTNTPGNYDTLRPLAVPLQAFVTRVFDDVKFQLRTTLLGRLGRFFCQVTSDFAASLDCHELALKLNVAEHGGRNHPDVAATLGNMALVYKAQGNYEKALEMHEEELKIEISFKGREHPDVAATLGNMGSVYMSMGEYEKALKMHEEELAIEIKFKGREHPDVAATLRNMGVVLDSQGEYEKALEKYAECRRIEDIVWPGHVHPDVAATLGNMALVYEAQGNYEKALEMHEEELKIEISFKGHEHLDVAKTLNNIALVYDSQGKYEEALSNYEEALVIKIKVFGGHNYPDVAATLNNIANVYESQGKYEEALSKYEESLAIKIKVHGGRNHPDVAATLGNMAVVHKAQGNYAKSLELNEEILKIFTKVHGGHNHPDVAATLGNMATVYQSMGNYEKALEMHEEELKIEISFKGHEHPDVATTYMNIAKVLVAQGDKSGAKAAFIKAKQGFAQAHGTKYDAYFDGEIAKLT